MSSTPSNSIQGSAAQPNRRRPSWLLVLAILVGIFGAFAVIANLGMLAVRILGNNQIPWSDVPQKFRVWEIELRLVAMLAGGILIASAFFLAGGRWKRGALLFIAALFVAISNPSLNRT